METLQIIESDESTTFTSSSDSSEYDWATMIAAPTSLTDIQGEEEPHSEVETANEYAGPDEEAGAPILIDFNVLKEEISNIQQDQQVLITRLDNLANKKEEECLPYQGENGLHLGIIGGEGEICPYILDDELTGGQYKNATYVHNIIKDLQEMSRFNQFANALVHQVRNSAILAPVLANPLTFKKPKMSLLDYSDEETEID